MEENRLADICKLVRYLVLTSTSNAGSGHPTSCLSATEIATVLFAGGYFRYDVGDPDNPLNDRFLISKGHVAPLLYSLWALAGAFDKKELLNLRKIDSELEGHPTFRFKYSEAATGSLGQGLSIGCGMAEGVKLKVKSSKLKVKRLPRVFVLLGDSELSEGQVWEAFQWAGYRKINNLYALVDVNRLGQRGETMWGWDLESLASRIKAFAWEVFIVKDGNDVDKVKQVYDRVLQKDFGKPVAILFKTIKGKGISFLENKDGWHGKALSSELLEKALEELGEVNYDLKINLPSPLNIHLPNKGNNFKQTQISSLTFSGEIATREVYGKTLNLLYETGAKNIVVLDAEVSNSTYAKDFAEKHPERFFEMFIAEQNMVSVALGLSRYGFVPFLSSFAAFLTRAFDQIRMSQYSNANLKIIGTHAGVSIGQDGPSQMGLEDIAMFRSVLNSVVLYPSDAVSSTKLIQKAYSHKGLVYIRLTRAKTPIIYSPDDEFEIGGFKVVKKCENAEVVLIGAGITLHECLKAANLFENQGIKAKVIDLYTIKPLDREGLERELEGAKFGIVVEDHYPSGGIFEAIRSVVEFNKLYSLAVKKLPRSGKKDELLVWEGISADKIVEFVKKEYKR